MEGLKRMNLLETFSADRREHATDKRGVPTSYANAMAGFKEKCTHCDDRPIVVNGSGVGLCARHQTMHMSGIQQRDRMSRQIAMAKKARV